MIFHNRNSKNVSNIGSIIGLSAQPLKGRMSKMTPLSKHTHNKTITGTSEPHLI